MREPSKISPLLATIIVDDEEAGEIDTTGRFSNNVSSSVEGLTIDQLTIEKEPGTTILDEVKEIITLPSEPTKYKVDPFSIELSPEVTAQLTEYVTAIAQMYRDNPFHSFEHASHVTMSVCKLLSRVVTPESIDYKRMEVTKQGEEELHKYTYGITSDPITQFACALFDWVNLRPVG
jgi:hypothetical protein